MAPRNADITRHTRETQIHCKLCLDEPAHAVITTNHPLFTHFLTALAQHSGFRLELSAEGDVEVDPHHLIEDVGIVLGQALDQALADRSGITRYGQRWLPMDEALVLTVVDFSGRGQLYWHGPFPDRPVNGVAPEVWPEFFNGLARHAKATLHVRCVAGVNAHHVYEAAFKGLGRALAEAASLTASPSVPSTKGTL